MKSKKIQTDFPAWLPISLLKKINNKLEMKTCFSDAEKSVLKKIKHETPSIWTEKCRVVRSSSIPGKWQNIFTPYLPSLMDALRYQGVEMGIACKSPQTALTEAAINILGHSADHLPGPAMVVYADKDTAKDIMKDRIIPMFEDSKRLRRHLTGAVGDESTIRINLKHMPVYLAWAGSVARLGSRPIRLMILDEIDKYPESKREASAEALAEKRTITWRSRRLVFKLSTPTTENGAIWIAFNEEAQAKFDWHVACSFCGAMQVMTFDQIKWAEEIKEPEEILQGKLAYYECLHCKAHWDDTARDLAVRKGQWIERKSDLEIFAHLELHKPSKIGFHIPAWLSYFVSLSEVAHSFLKYKKSGRLKDLKDFMTQYKAEAWTEEFVSRAEDTILALCDDRPAGIVLSAINGISRIAGLVAGVDTQGTYFRYVIRAFGYGDEEESWLIQAGTAPTFAALDEILWKKTYYDSDGLEYAVQGAMIDAMGNRTKKVYAYCAKNKRALAYQGKQSQASPVVYSHIDYFPSKKGEKVKIPGGLILRRVDTTFFKSDLAEKLTINAGDPGCFWLHSNIAKKSTGVEHQGVLAEYAREMCAEVFNPEKLIWENPKERPNHFWDCEVMALATAWELKIRQRRPPVKNNNVEVKTHNERPKPKNISAGDRLASIRRK